MKLHIKNTRTGTHILLDGDFISEVDQVAFREKIGKLVEGGNIHLVVDLAGVKYINSCGIGSLICALTRVRKAGGDLRLAGIKGHVEEVIRLTNLDRIFGITQAV